jgi:hypothetical protein
LIDPRRRAVELHAPGRPITTLTGGDTLDGAGILPGFELPLSRLFAVLD